MKSFLDNIAMTVPKGRALIDDCMNVTQGLIDVLGDKIHKLHSITLDGYGSSRTAALVATSFIEKVSGLPVNILIPNNVTRQIVADPEGLYVFISESGNSKLLEKDIDLVKTRNGLVALVTANVNSILAKKADCVICTGCDDEEFFFHTVGQCSSTITLMCIGMRLGLERKVISQEQYQQYRSMANAALDNHPNMVEQAHEWAKKHIDAFVNARCIVLFGSGPLYGVADEGALKIQEITEKNLAKGYEIYQRIYGSTTCFGSEDVVIVLDDGVNETIMGKGIADYMYHNYANGYLIGPEISTDNDMKIEIKGGDFKVLEYLAIMEVLAYEIALAENHPILDKDHYDADFFENYVKAKGN